MFICSSHVLYEISRCESYQVRHLLFGGQKQLCLGFFLSLKSCPEITRLSDIDPTKERKMAAEVAKVQLVWVLLSMRAGKYGLCGQNAMGLLFHFLLVWKMGFLSKHNSNHTKNEVTCNCTDNKCSIHRNRNTKLHPKTRRRLKNKLKT